MKIEQQLKEFQVPRVPLVHKQCCKLWNLRRNFKQSEEVHKLGVNSWNVPLMSLLAKDLVLQK